MTPRRLLDRAEKSVDEVIARLRAATLEDGDTTVTAGVPAPEGRGRRGRRLP